MFSSNSLIASRNCSESSSVIKLELGCDDDGGGGVTTLLLLNKHLLCDDETDEVDGDVDCGGVFWFKIEKSKIKSSSPPLKPPLLLLLLLL